jgi:hypothetical protein
MKFAIKESLLFFFLFICGLISGQEKPKVGLDAGLEVVNRYVWRGQLCSDALNFQPYITAQYGCFSLTGFGSYAASKNFAEVDLIASVSLGGFELTVSDYYGENEEDLSQNSYFGWDRTSTAHLVEATLSYDLPFEKIPLKLSYGMMLYGDDLNENDHQNYSTYFEVLYPFTVQDYSVSAFVAGTGNKGYYGSKASVVNAGLSVGRSLAVSSNYSLGLNASFIVNPNAEDVFFVVGITF